MASKQRIVAELGEKELLLADRIARSLAANDEVKYYFALLQTARANADRPSVPVPDCKAERIACRLPDAFLDEVVAAAAKLPQDCYQIPHSAEILNRIAASIGDMLACLPEDEQRVFKDRLQRLSYPKADRDRLTGSAIDAMTSGDRSAGDSFHLVVMDAHRAINKLQAATAQEVLDGAHVQGLSARSRRLVSAFMAGLQRTAPLKFNHPGLGTTAMQSGNRLLIQNDIGTTDAHVLVIRVDGLVAVMTYTDVHEARLKFFQNLFSGFNVAWENGAPRASDKFEDGAYILTTGTYRAGDEQALASYLEHLASRIVFLIDWNHMRKRLSAFVSKSKAVEILKWAADNDFGHRALIEVGGERTLAAAIEYAAGKRLRYGERLDDIIGETKAAEFICEAMKIASLGLRAGHSHRMIHDEMGAQLRCYLETSGLAIFGIAARHAACGYDLAAAVREAFEHMTGNGNAWLAQLGKRATAWEARADRLLIEARENAARLDCPPSLLEFFKFADDAVDELEEAASLLELFGLVASDKAPVKEIRLLADIGLASAQELVKAIECAAAVSRADIRDDLDDFLLTIERLIALEHQADDQTRMLRRRLVLEVEDPRALYVVHQLSQAIETATDAYLHAGQALRGYLMEEART